MEDLLIHTSNVKVDVLIPNKRFEYERPCLYFSLNQFISFFGGYVYLFKKSTLEENFRVERNLTKGVEMYNVMHIDQTQPPVEYVYQSEGLGYEFRVYEPVDVRRYGVGVITNFNHLKGVLERRMTDKVIREAIDFSREKER